MDAQAFTLRRLCPSATRRYHRRTGAVQKCNPRTTIASALEQMPCPTARSKLSPENLQKPTGGPQSLETPHFLKSD
jgi:hypothetical protein